MKTIHFYVEDIIFERLEKIKKSWGMKWRSLVITAILKMGMKDVHKN